MVAAVTGAAAVAPGLKVSVTKKLSSSVIENCFHERLSLPASLP